MRTRKALVYSLITTILIVGYAFALKCWNSELLTDVITTILALFAAVTFWIEYSNSINIKQAEFIMELNNQFVTNPDFKKVERDLEKYFDSYAKKEISSDSDKQFRDMYSQDSIDRQALVNYLVHLEGIATLVSSGQLKLKQISNLMAYRYFIAVNNPIVQELELRQESYRDHYKGIYSIYSKWERYLKKGKVSIPMKDEALVPENEKNVYGVITKKCQERPLPETDSPNHAESTGLSEQIRPDC